MSAAEASLDDQTAQSEAPLTDSKPNQSEAFEKAVADSKKLTSKPSNDDLLELYG